MDIKVYESRRGMAWLWAGVSATVGLLLLNTFARQRDSDIFTAGVVLAAVIFATYYFARQARHPPRLRVQKDALIIERPGKAPAAVPWNHIDSFVVVRRRGLELLGYRLRKGAPKPMFSAFGRLFEGADEVLYGFWPDNAKTMVAALSAYQQQFQDLSAPLDRNAAIVSGQAAAPAPAPTPRPAPRYVPPPPRPQAAPAVAAQAVSEPRRWFSRKPKTDESGNKPIVW